MSHQSLYRAKAKFWPSGKVSLIYRYPCIENGGRASDLHHGCAVSPESILPYWEPPSPPCQSCQTSARSREGEVGTADKTGDSLSEAAKPGHGTLGNKSEMSWKTGRQLRERMAACEREYDRRNLWFLTLTLPGGCKKTFKELAKYSAWIIDRLNRQFKRFFAGENFIRCSVWEYQRRGALHLHVLLASDCIHAKPLSEFRMKMARGWHRILTDLGRRTGCRPFMSRNGLDRTFEEIWAINKGKYFVNCDVVRKSVVAYLSSYLSESNHEKDKKGKQNLRNKFWPVSTWAQWDRAATKLFEKHSQEIDLGECPNIDKKHIDQAIQRIEKRLPLADGTEIKRPKNPFNHGIYFLYDPTMGGQTETIKEIIKEELSNVFSDDWGYQRWLSQNAKIHVSFGTGENEYVCNFEDELLLRTQQREARLSSNLEAEMLGDELAFMGLFMLELMQGLDAHLAFNPYKIYQQLELILWPENRSTS